MNDSDGSHRCVHLVHDVNTDNSEDPLPRRFTPMAGYETERQPIDRVL
jgi:hypothetical protein